jgi:hypothetical protein
VISSSFTADMFSVRSTIRISNALTSGVLRKGYTLGELAQVTDETLSEIFKEDGERSCEKSVREIRECLGQEVNKLLCDLLLEGLTRKLDKNPSLACDRKKFARAAGRVFVELAAPSV